MTTNDTDPSAAVTGEQPALPGIGELPEYHGKPATGMRTSLTGAGSRITRSHEIGDRVVLVIEARVRSAGHEQTDDGLVYVEKLKVDDLFELAGDQGRRLLSTMRSLHRTAEDAVQGRQPIGDLGEVGYTDAAGVVLTPAEVAELRGDPVRAILAPELTPAVVVFDDGTRDLWPDDYAKDTPRPHVGAAWKNTTTGEQLVVVELLHHETGEQLAHAPEGAGLLANIVRETVHTSATEIPGKKSRSGNLAAVPDLPPAADEAETDQMADPAASPTFGVLTRPIVEVLDYVEACSDPAELEALLTAEQIGKNRARIVKAIQRNIDAVAAADLDVDQ